MNVLSVENISKSYGLKMLFSDISFGLADDEKLGLIGVNGTGKSTFLKVLAGLETPDQGNVVTGRGVRISYLPQNPVFDDQVTVLEQIFQDGSILSPDIWQAESEAKNVLTKLGIYDFEAQMGTLSGGQKKRIALASALVNPADLLILDEPTNHIDNETVIWLEQYLNRRKGALIMITHDRYFLDRVVNRIIELDRGRLFSYTGNYSQFLEAKLAREEQERSTELKRLNLLRNELHWIKRGAKARSTKQKARIDRFERLQAEKTNVSPDKIEISVGASRLGKKVISLEGVSKSFSGRQFIKDFSCPLQKNDRVGIVGPNGIGKSTLLNIMAGRIEPDSGKLDVGLTVKIGFFSQENSEMDENLRAIEYIKEQAEFIPTSDGKLISASQMMERFLFSSELQWAPIAKLSGGERRRLYLLRILMGAPNVLLLDEPTNDLDIHTLSILEDYLDEFPGAVIAVSHDRYFLDRVVDKIIAFTSEGRVQTFLGSFTEYMESAGYKESDQDRSNETAGIKGNSEVKPRPAENANDENLRPLKFTFNEQREYETIDAVISEAENKLSELKGKIDQAGSDFMLLQELLSAQEGLAKELDKLMERWTYLNELAEMIEQNKNSRKGACK